MGLMSTLALLAIPLTKRTIPSSPPTIDPQIAALKGRITELETAVKDLNRKLDNVERDNLHLRRDRDHWYTIIQLQRAQQSPDYSALLGFQNGRPSALNLYQQYMNPNAQNQHSLWHNCTCVPGRSAAFRLGDGS